MFRLCAITTALLMLVSGLTATFTIAGAVLKPGDFEFKQGMSVRQAVELAGVAKNADLRRVAVEVSGKTRVEDLAKLGPSALLREGAKITVPEIDIGRYVTVSGAVVSPGRFEYGKGATLGDAVSKARPYDGARLDSVKLTRTLANGKVQTYRLNLKNLHANAAAMPGDFIEVSYPGAATSDRELLTIVVIGILVLLLLR